MHHQLIPMVPFMFIGLALSQDAVRQPDTRSPGVTHESHEFTHRINPALKAELERDFKPSTAVEKRARELLKAGQILAAEEECRKAVALSPRISTPSTGPVIANSEAVKLLGEIYLREGKNREALKTFLPSLPHTAGSGPNLNVVIAYCRLGDFQNAKRYYSDSMIQTVKHEWQSFGGLSDADIPGTRTLATLEASALYSIGLDIRAEARVEEALEYLLAAERLVPKNPLIAHAVAGTYMRLHNPEEAWPRYQTVMARGHGTLVSRSKEHVEGLKAWFRPHPSQKIGPIKP